MRLIYSRSRTPFGLLVRAASWWGQWSHCGIVTGDGTVIHAHALRGVVEEPLPEFARRYSLHALVDVAAPNSGSAMIVASAACRRNTRYRLFTAKFGSLRARISR